MKFTLQNVLIATESGYETQDVQIQDDRITAIAPRLNPEGTCIDGRHQLLLPGFVNAHTHSSEMWQRGIIPPVPLELWLGEVYDFTPLDPEQVYLSALGTAVETLLTGGTTVVDHLVLIPGQERETIAAVAKAYQAVGIRAVIAPLIQDQSLVTGIPTGGIEQEYTPYVRSTADSLALMEDTIAQFHQPDAGLYIALGPTGMQLCSDQLLLGCIELSEKYHLCRHTHLLETKAQVKLAEEKYGCSAVEHLKHLEFLGSRTSLAHCVWLNDHDIELLAATQSTVVHNPLSNLRLGSGIAPVLKYRQAGVNVAFGCDGSASNDSQDLLEAIKIGSMLHNITDLDYRFWITPREAVTMAAQGGANGINLGEEMGSVTVGKKADLVLYDLTQLSLLPRTDPIGLLVYGRPTQVVSHAWVNGQPVIMDGKIQRIQVADLLQELFERSQWQSSRHSPMLRQFEPQYRTVMGLSR